MSTSNDPTSSTTDASVDSTPISPIMRERTNTLEHALAKRPDTKDLLDRGILHAPPSVSPTVVQRQHELEMSMTRDALKTHLNKRPEREELVQRNILPDSHASPAIQAQQRELERSMKEDALREKLAHRPQPQDIIKQGILNADDDPTKPGN